MLAGFNITDLLAAPGGEDFLKGFLARSYNRDALVCSGNLDENGVFIVSNGRLRVFLAGEDHEITLFYLRAGDLFSMHSGCMIEASEDSLLWMTDLATFHQKLQSCPGVSYNLISILGRALTSCIRTIQDLAFHDIRQRLVRFFLERADHAAKDPQGPVDVTTPSTVEDIALMIGSGRQATSTAISLLIKEGYVARLRRGHYHIPDVARLRALSEGHATDVEGHSQEHEMRMTDRLGLAKPQMPQ